MLNDMAGAEYQLDESITEMAKDLTEEANADDSESSDSDSEEDVSDI